MAIPNNNLYDHISKNTSFHLLASLPIEKATVMDEFDILPCASTDFTELKGSLTIEDNLISPQSIIPSALSIINKHASHRDKIHKYAHTHTAALL